MYLIVIVFVSVLPCNQIWHLSGWVVPLPRFSRPSLDCPERASDPEHVNKQISLYPDYLSILICLQNVKFTRNVLFDSDHNLVTWKGWEFGRQSREALGAPLPPPPFVSAGMIVFTDEALSLLKN
jgi:hypothetical protein